MLKKSTGGLVMIVEESILIKKRLRKDRWIYYIKNKNFLVASSVA